MLNCLFSPDSHLSHLIQGSLVRGPGPQAPEKRSRAVSERAKGSGFKAAPRAPPLRQARSACPGVPRGQSGHHPGDPCPPARRPAAAQLPLPRFPLSARGSSREKAAQKSVPTTVPPDKIRAGRSLRPANRSSPPSWSSRGTAIRAGAAPPPASAQNTTGPTWLVPPLPRQGLAGRGNRAGELKGRVRDPAEQSGYRSQAREKGGGEGGDGAGAGLPGEGTNGERAEPGRS